MAEKTESYEPLISVIVIDYKPDNPMLVECLEAISRQTYTYFEIILLTDYETEVTCPKLTKIFYGKYMGPAIKRDDGAKHAKGEILAFIDDDAYPASGWLKALVKHFEKEEIAAVGGPGVTPPGVTIAEAASGWASASPLGSGSFTYRFIPGKRRFVDDYPSMNLAVRRSDFIAINGFDSNYWPGEDTKLCLDLVYKLHKKILYEPLALVYHHRRPLLRPHLHQNGNFGLHRGYFARVLPQTSLKLVYLAPPLMSLGLIFFGLTFPLQSFIQLPILLRFIEVTNRIILASLVIYATLLFLNALWVGIKSKNVIQLLLSAPITFITHFWYGLRFLQGFLFTKKLNQ